jgi:beta-galactosidase
LPARLRRATPHRPLSAANNGSLYSITISNAAGTASVTSTPATLALANYTTYPGFVGVDLNNLTNGSWSNSQIYVTVIGIDPNTNVFA